MAVLGRPAVGYFLARLGHQMATGLGCLVGHQTEN